MASIKRHPKSPFWMACFTLPDGRRTTRSTGTSEKKEAQRIANHFEDAANVGKVKKLTESRARKTIADIYALSNRDILPSSTIKDFFTSWLKRKQLEAGDLTHVRYSTVVGQLLKYLGPRALLDITHLNAKEISEFREDLGKRVSPGTVNISLKILRSALNQAKHDGLTDINEAERVTLLKIRKTTRREAFNEEQLKQLLTVADMEWKGMILFGIYTGLRLGDIATLLWRNIDLMQKAISLTTAKTGRIQVLPLTRPLVRFLEALPARESPDAPLFPSAFATKQRSQSIGTLSNQFHKILEAANLADKRSHGKRGQGRSVSRAPSILSFHSLRHTATSMLKNAGVSDSVTMDIIGHESAAVSQNYDSSFWDDLEPLKLKLLVRPNGGSIEEGTCTHHPLKQQILKLEDFSTVTRTHWWIVAKEILKLHTQDRPWKDPELKKLYPRASISESKLRAKIYDKVRRAFVNSAY